MKKRNWLVCSFILTAGLALLLTACNKPAAQESKQESKKEIVIGAVGAMSGPSATLGNGTKNGMELAIKEINANGGIMGMTVRAVYRDDEADPTKAKSYIEEELLKEHADFIIGPSNSTSVAATEAFINQNKKVQILNIATASALIDANQYPYTFRIMLPNNMQAEALVKLALAKGYQKIALVQDTSALGAGGLADMKKYLTEAGKQSVAEVSYTPNATDMTPVAQKIKDSGADCALFWTLGADGAKIVKALERVNYIDNLEILGYTGISLPNFQELAGPGATKCSTIGIAAWAPPRSDAKFDDTRQKLYEKIVAEYGPYGPGKRDINPSTIATGYDAVMLLKAAIEKAQSVDSDKVKEALESGDQFKGYYANNYAFSKTNHDGVNVDEIVQLEISTDKFMGELAYRLDK
ncbi:ABC transporter substrate-binding protein [Desulfosporosinus youngiae]|uniref:ABC-type branched-chain amino acid transport system, periplasmic component n=1 Tax=Desulfosporosinus youngiae DSM 17734 TaxID=768710 RepID=H5XUG7_9FIRM|nr:ABC transporter substrate-binding protein [Desulfosporosinus youngiae]EHQ89403.1 ABC-type branched-chain amino acid transport system, periplasmic component [Desulfosporosinus youngiae DSM 17734]